MEDRAITRRLAEAFLASAVFHGLVIAFWPPHPSKVNHGALPGRLDVSLPGRGQSSNATTLPIPESLEQSTPSTVLAMSDEPGIDTPPKPIQDQVSTRDNQGKGLTSTTPAVAAPRANSLPVGSVEVLLVINNDGEVHQIIWSKLPAMTDEMLAKLERRIRQKHYAAMGHNYTVTEVVTALQSH